MLVSWLLAGESANIEEATDGFKPPETTDGFRPSETTDAFRPL